MAQGKKGAAIGAGLGLGGALVLGLAGVVVDACPRCEMIFIIWDQSIIVEQLSFACH